MKPAMDVVELQQDTQLLTGSNYGMRTFLQSEEEVEDSW